MGDNRANIPPLPLNRENSPRFKLRQFFRNMIHKPNKKYRARSTSLPDRLNVDNFNPINVPSSISAESPKNSSPKSSPQSNQKSRISTPSRQKSSPKLNEIILNKSPHINCVHRPMSPKRDEYLKNTGALYTKDHLWYIRGKIGITRHALNNMAPVNIKSHRTIGTYIGLFESIIQFNILSEHTVLKGSKVIYSPIEGTIITYNDKFLLSDVITLNNPEDLSLWIVQLEPINSTLDEKRMLQWEDYCNYLSTIN